MGPGLEPDARRGRELEAAKDRLSDGRTRGGCEDADIVEVHGAVVGIRTEADRLDASDRVITKRKPHSRLVPHYKVERPRLEIRPNVYTHPRIRGEGHPVDRILDGAIVADLAVGPEANIERPALEIPPTR